MGDQKAGGDLQTRFVLLSHSGDLLSLSSCSDVTSRSVMESLSNVLKNRSIGSFYTFTSVAGECVDFHLHMMILTVDVRPLCMSLKARLCVKTPLCFLSISYTWMT